MEQGDATESPQPDAISEKVWHRESLSKAFVPVALARGLSVSPLPAPGGLFSPDPPVISL